ncbi:hypothetical protein JTB14_001285 [Gonioctena quinquepunctata]|nr:hypothetical protein JTB14_001285 [Gonioctena quinquepunctata]
MILMCRVCLTQSTNFMFKLADEFEVDEGKTVAVSYLQMLETVTSSKVVLNGNYPESICPICTSILKMSYQFIRQFEESQRELEEKFNCTAKEEPETNCQEITSEIKKEIDNTPNVELIFLNNKFSINDLLVVEKTEEEDSDFKGFLENLGKEVTASFVGELDEKKLHNDSENENMISVSVIDKDRILPVCQLQIDEDANLIEYTIEDNLKSEEDVEENLEISEERKYEISEELKYEENNEFIDQDEENANVEYIEIDMLDQEAINALIIDRSKLPDDDSANESTSNETTLIKKRPTRRGKRRKKGSEKRDEFEKEIQYPCDLCQSIFPTSLRLRAHKTRVHFPKERTYACEICGYLARTRSAFVHHKLKHQDKKFTCQLCNKSYSTKSVLKVHMGSHANKRQNLCSVCGKGFNYPNALEYHMRLHTGEKNYHCEFCNKRFRMPNSLNRHRRTHTGDKPFKCQYCGRAFCSRGEVTCHEYVHTGFRPYHCKYCRKGFSKTHNLKIHLLSHRGHHQCEICGKSFIEPAILAMHYKISHKEFLMQDEGESTDSQREKEHVVTMDYTDYK